MLHKIKNNVCDFHDDEAGLEALQVVMILAIAAVALIAIKTRWPAIRDWFHEVMQGSTTSDNWQSE